MCRFLLYCKSFSNKNGIVNREVKTYFRPRLLKCSYSLNYNRSFFLFHCHNNGKTKIYHELITFNSIFKAPTSLQQKGQYSCKEMLRCKVLELRYKYTSWVYSRSWKLFCGTSCEWIRRGKENRVPLNWAPENNFFRGTW